MTRAADLFDWAASRSRNWCVSAEVSRNSFVRPLVSPYLSLTGGRWLLVLVEGLSAAEVAQTLELSVDAVKSRLHRARKSLRERLAPWLEQSAPGPACPDVVELLSRYQEGDVTSEACKVMEAHVDGCPECAKRCHALRSVLSACSALPEPQLSDELRQTVTAQIRRALQRQTGAGS